jgi:Family of unknown function (DUF6111)
MIRIIIENVLLFLLPTFVYVAYVYMTRDEKPGAARVLDDAPLVWLFLAGAALMLTMLVVFGSMTGGTPGQTYTPPVLKDGHIEPGHVD